MVSYTQTEDRDHQVILLPTTGTGESAINRDGDEGNKGEEEEYERQQWSFKHEYILSAIGYCVGIGNVWRFPYMCNRNGGGAFLIPFLVSLVLCGLPLFFLESALGQFTGRSPLHCWSVCPLVKGIGVSMFAVSIVYFWHYTTVQAWALYYLAVSCQSTVPWSRCDQWWNTPRCADFSRTFQAASTVSNDTVHWSNDTLAVNGEPRMADMFNGTTSVTANETSVRGETTGSLVSSAEEFWQRNVLQVSGSFHEPGHLVWYLVVSVAAACLFLFFGLIKGVRSSGKVVYVTAVAPYIILTALLIRGATLPGALNGVVFYLKPDFSRVLDVQVWAEAALQVFYSLGPCWGCICTMASYNKFNNNCLRDSIFLTFVSEGTSIFGGFAIFSVLGYMAHTSGVSIDKVVSSGPGLAFIVYPEAISRMPFPQLWAVLFFIMVFTLCCDSQLVAGETILTVLCDRYPRTLSRHRMLITAVVCGAAFVLGLPFVSQGGIYLFQLVDWFIAALTVITVGFLECVVIGWVYGADQFGADIQMMIGRKPPLVMKILWLFVTPICLMVMFVFTMIKYRPPSYGSYQYDVWDSVFGWFIALVSLVPIPVVALYQLYIAQGSLRQVMFVFTMIKYRPPSYGSYQYDVWGSVFGWFIALVSLVPIPVVALYQLYIAQGSLRQRLDKTLTPDVTWGPQGHKQRQLYHNEKMQRPPRRHWTDVIRR